MAGSEHTQRYISQASRTPNKFHSTSNAATSCHARTNKDLGLRPFQEVVCTWHGLNALHGYRFIHTCMHSSVAAACSSNVDTKTDSFAELHPTHPRKQYNTTHSARVPHARTRTTRVPFSSLTQHTQPRVWPRPLTVVVPSLPGVPYFFT